jgi:hypothetical protein
MQAKKGTDVKKAFKVSILFQYHWRFCKYGECYTTSNCVDSQQISAWILQLIFPRKEPCNRFIFSDSCACASDPSIQLL